MTMNWGPIVNGHSKCTLALAPCMVREKKGKTQLLMVNPKGGENWDMGSDGKLGARSNSPTHS